MTPSDQDGHFARIVEQVDIDPKGLAIVLDTPEEDIMAWLTFEKEPPRWFENYLDMVWGMQRIGRVCYEYIGNPYE